MAEVTRTTQSAVKNFRYIALLPCPAIPELNHATHRAVLSRTTRGAAFERHILFYDAHYLTNVTDDSVTIPYRN